MTIIGIISFIGGVFANALLECSIFHEINFWGSFPDSVIIVVTAVSMVSSRRLGATYGAIAGALIDILAGQIIGTYTIIYMLCGIFSGFFYRRYYADNFYFAFGLGFLSLIFKEVVLMLLLVIQRLELNIAGAFLRYILPSALLTGIFAIPMFLIYRGIHKEKLRRSRFEH